VNGDLAPSESTGSGPIGPDDAAWYRTLIENSAVTTLVIAPDGTIAWASPGLETLTGYSPTDVVGRNALDFLHPDDLELALDVLDYSSGLDDQLLPMQFQLLDRKGHPMPVEIASTSLVDDPAIGGFVVSVRPVSEVIRLRHAMESLATGEPLAATMQLIIEAVQTTMNEMRCAIGFDPVDDRFRSFVATDLPWPLSGDPTRPDRADRPWDAVMAGPEPIIHETLDAMGPGLRRDAEALGLNALWLFPITIRGEEVNGVLIVWSRDIKMRPAYRQRLEQAVRMAGLAFERRRYEDRLIHAATHDSLTGIPNRSRFFDSLDTPGDANGQRAVLYIDLDGFKEINDEYGHAAGDDVLSAVADRMVDVIRPTDLVARIGGDEFAVLCRSVNTIDEATVIADRLLARLEEPIVSNGTSHQMSASIGIAVGPGDTVGDTLLDRADRALYQAKSDGRARWRLADLAPEDLNTKG
jgi:diguanylate cyclase (GGDEF)-like protein/PAS domain S-box-containing protein